MRMLVRTAHVAALFVALAVQAQSFEPRRTVSRQGVEMLSSRLAPAPPDAAAEDTPAPPPSAKPAPRVAVAQPSRVDTQVSPAQQAMRDDERERILNIEVLNEASQVDLKRKALQAAAAAGGPDGAQRQQLAEDLQRHEENLQALSREITLLRKQRGSAHRSAGTVPPSPVNWSR